MTEQQPTPALVWKNPSDPLFSWNGRPVRMAEITIRIGREVRKAFQQETDFGLWTLLVRSLRYADDDQPVFTSIDEIDDLPMRLQQRLMRLADAAAKANGWGVDQDDEEDSDNPPA